MNGLSVSGEIVTAGTALAGLILIYIGALVTSYGSFAATEQKSVKGKFQQRAWLAFVGLVLSLLAATLAIIGKSVNDCCTANASVIVILAAFGWGAICDDRCCKGRYSDGAHPRIRATS